MSQDVEITEDEKEIIEISDDESSNVVLVIDDDVEEISQYQPLNAAKTQHSNKASFNNYIFLEPKPDVHENEIKQENNNSQDRGIIAASVNNCVSHGTKSENMGTNNGRRKRNIGRKRINSSGTATKEMELSNIDDCDQHGNDNSRSFMQSTWSSGNINRSATYDFSKLKWLKPLSNLSSPPHLQMVIIDRSHPYWRIETEKWLMVEKRLLEALNTEMIRSNDPSIGLFDGAKWQRGIKVVGCHNHNAFDFIMKFLMSLDKLWNGAKLEAFPITQLNRHVVKAYIPPPTIKTEVAMSLIKLQNPTLHTSDWKVIRERERAYGGMDIWISINDQSFMELSIVRGEIKFGINRIFVNPS